ncbi:hypothetical protein [Amycolatopsis rubida]|uniref:hypothetical protein n=1 Tax=Amycolatopsis rubida TaxID=112413 RepID=UPI000B82A9B2|nr:hypothetical protein [Amycolatopsis rubida]
MSYLRGQPFRLLILRLGVHRAAEHPLDQSGGDGGAQCGDVDGAAFGVPVEWVPDFVQQCVDVDGAAFGVSVEWVPDFVQQCVDVDGAAFAVSAVRVPDFVQQDVLTVRRGSAGGQQDVVSAVGGRHQRARAAAECPRRQQFDRPVAGDRAHELDPGRTARAGPGPRPVSGISAAASDPGTAPQFR